MFNAQHLTTAKIVAACLIAGSVAIFPAGSETPQTKATKTPATPAAQQKPPVVPAKTSTPTTPGSHFHPSMASRARMYYSMVWGVDELKVRAMESGELIRFTYRVVDPEKAQTLNDKKNDPYLVDDEANVKLVVPSLEKVGQLRQSAAPEAGKVYWMAFSNKGGLVKPGHQVTVMIGNFKATDLAVE